MNFNPEIAAFIVMVIALILAIIYTKISRK